MFRIIMLSYIVNNFIMEFIYREWNYMYIYKQIYIYIYIYNLPYIDSFTFLWRKWNEITLIVFAFTFSFHLFFPSS